MSRTGGDYWKETCSSKKNLREIISKVLIYKIEICLVLLAIRKTVKNPHLYPSCKTSVPS
jgi:hypothetical protein